MVQVGLRVPTPLAVRKGQFSCEFLARLQELCLHGSQCPLSAQASWLCQVCMNRPAAARQIAFLHLCVCVYNIIYNLMQVHSVCCHMLCAENAIYESATNLYFYYINRLYTVYL